MNLPLPLLLLLLRLSGRRRRYESVEGLRRAHAQDRRRRDVAPPASLRRHVALSERLVAGRPCYTLAPRAGQAPSATRLLYLHGGAFVSQIVPQHWQLVAELVRASGCTASVPLYPLAPEHAHGAAFAMLEALYRELAAAPGPLVLMGDSAGAGLALALVQGLAEAGVPAPRELVMLSPWLDLSLASARRTAGTMTDPWLALPGMAEAARWWAGGSDPAAPRLSPLHGRLQGIGRLSLYIGQRDLLLGEARALRDRAAAEGVAIEYHEAPRMPHVWPLLPLREAAPVRQRLAQLLRAET
ncbi:alpha/beta hydrolase fold domain-containing protein [Paucibacter soli]|uniref:alpha/beta hydrolase fold domain-containing protein n=1 Tax=Paucibacter soli TaxID=3133433 RepID=UPI00309B3661